jgi:SAM-dependent methyltransferase
VSADTTGTSQPIDQRAILDIATGFQRSRVLLTAYEIGLFTVLNDEWKTSAEVAEALETNPRATDRLMNALTALGILVKKDSRFVNSPSAARLLVRGRPDYMAGLAHTAHLWRTWSGLTQSVRTGTGNVGDEVNERGEEWLRAFIGAMHWRAQSIADETVTGLDLSNVSTVLDVGGGSGAFSMAFVRAGRGIHAVVFDLPNVVPMTRNYVASAGYGAQVSTVVGDYRKDELPAGFDMVFLSAIIHSLAPDGNRDLIRKAAAAAAPGGQVVVLDHLMNEERSGPLPAAMFALNMLVGTGAGDTYTESEVRSWMQEAGLHDIVRKPTPSVSSFMIGLK